MEITIHEEKKAISHFTGKEGPITDHENTLYHRLVSLLFTPVSLLCTPVSLLFTPVSLLCNLVNLFTVSSLSSKGNTIYS